MARKWTEEQLQAIETKGGTVLVSAAAGSGKTAVLVERLVKKITDIEHPVSADRFLVVTFTKAAAAEMRERIAKRLREILHKSPDNTFLQHQIHLLNQAQICTIDSFFSTIVRENFEKLGISPTLKIAEDNFLSELSDEVLNNVLEKKYNENSNSFINLLQYFGDETDESLKAEVLSIYKKIRSLPFPLKWLDEQVNLYKNKTAIEETVYGRILIGKVCDGVSFSVKLLDDMLLFLQTDKNIYDTYSIACIEDAKQLKALNEVCNEKSWDKIYKALNGFNFVSLKRLSGKYSKEIKEKFIILRKSLKAEIESLKSLIPCTEKEYIADMEIQALLIEELFDIVKKFYNAFQKEKNELDIADFSDFAYLTLKLVADENGNPTELAKDISTQYEEILLDEYQDTNFLQDLIFKCISKNEENLFLVGDLKQSIYRFRNANPIVFMDKKQKFTPYDGENFPAAITLSKNFRSRKGITDGINAIFSKLMSIYLGDVDYGESEMLNCGADYPEIENSEPEISVLLIDAKEENSEDHRLLIEARETAKQISKMLNEKFPVTENGKLRPCRGEDFVILLRSTKNGIADIFVSALKEANIEAVSESSEGYFSSREVSIMISLLKVLDNPMLNTEMAAVLLSPMFSFSCDELSSLFIYNPNKSLYSALIAQAQKGKKKAKHFIDTFNLLREKSAVMSIQRLIQYIYDTTDFIEVISSMSASSVREANLKLLLKYALDFEATGKNELTNFISYIDSLIESKKDFEIATPSIQTSQAVKIMTIHKSKGLEFPIVILGNCSKKHNAMDLNKNTILNSNLGYGLKFIDSKKLLKYETVPFVALKSYEKQCLLSEELRLLYVAMTRAKEKLILNISEPNLQSTLTKKIEIYVENNGTVKSYVASKGVSYSEWLLMAFVTFVDFKDINLKYSVLAPENCNCPLEILLPTETFFTNKISDEQSISVDNCMLDNLKERVYYKYPYENDTKIPAKLSVTEISHSDFTTISLNAPRFTLSENFTPAQKGSIFHKVLQFADFEKGKENASSELQRLIDNGYITLKESEAININKLSAFFNSSLTDRILKADRVLREYKFFDTIKASEAGYEGDSSILIQGIADCVIEENQKGILIDFKTDIIENPEILVYKYKKQLTLYKNALEKLFPKGIDECILYSLHLGKEIKIIL